MPPPSEWDRLPAELVDMVLEHAGPLTALLCGRASAVTTSGQAALWADVFEQDWEGDLGTLPCGQLGDGSTLSVFRRLRSRGMYARVKALGSSKLDDGLVLAAMNNVWTDELDLDDADELSINAAEHGCLGLLAHLADDLCVVQPGEFHAWRAAKHGQLGVLQWLDARLPASCWTSVVMDFACSSGSLACVEWIHTAHACASVDSMNWAAADGHLDIVAFLHANRTEGCTPDAMDWAAENGHAHVVAWLHHHRTEGCTPTAMRKAAENGHVAVVAFLHAHRSESTIGEAALCAAAAGKVGVLEWIWANAPNALTPAVADAAAAAGEARVLAWLAGHAGVSCTHVGISRAVAGGHLHLVPWFRDNAPTLFESHPASRIGNESAAGVVEWLARDGMPRKPGFVMHAAIESKQAAVVRWLLWHLPDARWKDGDMDRAAWLVRLS
ncbi:hypothetical protein HK105_208061 [Polyrhizophydium stewartii]|uniref:Ankyrin repeat domain containing protein n=1 Tax=Polyrhizophydium stewartii TaxID=2732419 RepID=A0ABR4MZ14_9FUNG